MAVLPSPGAESRPSGGAHHTSSASQSQTLKCSWPATLQITRGNVSGWTAAWGRVLLCWPAVLEPVSLLSASPEHWNYRGPSPSVIISCSESIPRRRNLFLSQVLASILFLKIFFFATNQSGDQCQKCIPSLLPPQHTFY